MKGAEFGATSAIVTAIVLIGAFAYLVIDRQMFLSIITGKRPISDLPILATSTLNRFQFVLGASTTEEKTPTSKEILSLIEKLPASEKIKLQVQTCQQVFKGLPR